MVCSEDLNVYFFLTGRNRDSGICSRVTVQYCRNSYHQEGRGIMKYDFLFLFYTDDIRYTFPIERNIKHMDKIIRI